MPVVCHRCYAPRVEELLRWRREVQERYDAGGTPTFLEETRAVRSPRGLSGPRLSGAYQQTRSLATVGCIILSIVSLLPVC